MKRVLGGLFAICVFLLCAGLAQAQFSDGSSEVSITAGAALPTSKTDYAGAGGGKEGSVKSGVGIGGRYLYHTSSKWAFGGEFSYTRFGEKEHTMPAVGVVIKEEESVMLLEGLAKYTFKPENKTRPYLLGGLGYGSLIKKSETTPITGFAWSDTGTTESRENFDESIGGPSISLGVGLESFVGDNVFWSLEGRYKAIGASKEINDKVFSSKWDVDGNTAFLISASFGWKFGQ